MHKDWISVDPVKETMPPPYFVGQNALDLDDQTREIYQLLYPMYAKSINSKDYFNLVEWRYDVAAIWHHLLHSELGIASENPSQFYHEMERTKVVLVVPDLMDVRIVEEMMLVLLEDLHAQSVIIGTESPLSCVGAGLSTAVVIDIGAQATSVGLVEMGELTDASRILIGGDDITQVLFELLNENRFPLSRQLGTQLAPGGYHAPPPRNQELIEEIKEKWCTCLEHELAIQVVDLHLREPGEVTLKYQVKVYNEIYFAPLCLFYPSVVNIKEKLKSLKKYSNLLLGMTYQGCLQTGPSTEMLSPPVTVPWSLHPGLSSRTTLTVQLMYLDALMEQQELPVAKPFVLKHPCHERELRKMDVPDAVDDGEETSIEDPMDEDQPPSTEPALEGLITKTKEKGSAAPFHEAGAQVPIQEEKKAPPPIDPQNVTPNPAPLESETKEARCVPPLLTISTYAREWIGRPLDVVIHSLIQGVRTEDRMKKLYGSLIVLGGSAHIPGLASRLIEDRVRRSLPSNLSAGAASSGAGGANGVEWTVSVTPPPRDMDPRTLAWKGGTVLARLDCASDMWVTLGDLRAYGAGAAVAHRAGVVLAGSAIEAGISPVVEP
jgi:hypothetical protein